MHAFVSSIRTAIQRCLRRITKQFIFKSFHHTRILQTNELAEVSKKTVSRECELVVSPPVIDDESIVCSAQLQRPGKSSTQIWFKLPKQHRLGVTRRADAFIIAALLSAAETASVLRVKGAPASPSLLRNLEEFQHVWQAWRGFKVVEVDAATGPAESRADRPAIAAFSGGVDFAFTIWRHAKDLRSQRQDVTAALMVHGFDIPLHDYAGFGGALARARRMLDSVDIPVIPIQTNIRALFPDWELSHGMAVAAVLTVLSGKFATGLIASAGTYHLPLIPWGSNPFTDPMLGSSSFVIVHDGASTSRLNKVRALCRWPEAIKELRFCFQNTPSDGNCGRCLKCILTVLEFKCTGIEPDCFSERITDGIIVETLSNYMPDPHGDLCFREVLDAALTQGMKEPWVPLLQDVLLPDSRKSS